MEKRAKRVKGSVKSLHTGRSCLVNNRSPDTFQLHCQLIERGNQRGSVVIGGQRVAVQRPRLRTKGKEEVPLTSYERFHDATERTRGVYEHLVSGISCRKYAEVIEAIRDGYGISRSVVSREMKAATSQQLQTLCERDLSGFELCVVVIDGIHIGESIQIVSLGVDRGGRKQVLGFREGATENAQVCVELFEDLVQRKLRLDRAVLVVIDGPKGLRAE